MIYLQVIAQDLVTFLNSIFDENYLADFNFNNNLQYDNM